MAMPPPMPVDPSWSRFSISAATASPGISRLAEARAASVLSRVNLSLHGTSMHTLRGDSIALMSIVGFMRWRRSLRRPEAVADAGFRQEILRPLRILLDLASQLAHVDAQVLRVGRLIPQLAQQEFVRQHLA